MCNVRRPFIAYCTCTVYKSEPRVKSDALDRVTMSRPPPAAASGLPERTALTPVALRLSKPAILLARPYFREAGMKRWIGLLFVLAVGITAAARQSASPSASLPLNSVSSQAPAAPNPEFLKTADEVLQQMSVILHLPIDQPLKKTLRSKQEIRDYLIREEKEDKNEAQRYADTKSLEAFGLIPKGFPLDSFMLDVLTDQVAGLYDPKAKEFYIADWIP